MSYLEMANKVGATLDKAAECQWGLEGISQQTMGFDELKAYLE